MRITRDYRCDTCDATMVHQVDSGIPLEADIHHHGCAPWASMHAELSAVPTTFKFADHSARKHRRG